jgi:hypothetical protein
MYTRETINGWLRICIQAALRLNKPARAAHIATLVTPWSAL